MNIIDHLYLCIFDKGINFHIVKEIVEFNIFLEILVEKGVINNKIKHCFQNYTIEYNDILIFTAPGKNIKSMSGNLEKVITKTNASYILMKYLQFSFANLLYFYVMLENNNRSMINLEEYYRKIYFIIKSQKLISTSDRYIDNEMVFDPKFFKKYILISHDKSEYCWKVKHNKCKQHDYKQLYDRILDNIFVLDVETIGTKTKYEIGIDSEVQEIFSIGILSISKDLFNQLIQHNISFTNIYELNQLNEIDCVKYINQFFKIYDSETVQRILQLAQKAYRRTHILLFFNESIDTKKYNLLYILNLVNQKTNSTNYIYTFNGKGFDFFILIKTFMQYLSNIEIKKIIEVNRLIYSFELHFKDIFLQQELNRYQERLNSGMDIKSIYSSTQIKHYTTLIKNPKFLLKVIIFRDISTITGIFSLKNAYNKFVDHSLFEKDNFDIMQYMNKVKKDINTVKDNENHNIYLFGDLYSLLHIIHSLFYELIIILNINPLHNFTIASISMQLFKRELSNKYPFDIFKTKDTYINNIIYNSIYGGRVYCNKPFFNFKFSEDNIDFLKEKLKEYHDIINKFQNINFCNNSKLIGLDINSLYPSAMINNFFPIGKKYYIEINMQNYKIILFNRLCFIAFVEFYVPSTYRLLHLPTKSSNNVYTKSYMYKEIIKGIYNNVDIISMINLGYKIIDIKGGIIWPRKAKIFNNHISKLYQERVIGNKVKRNLMKLIMNSLYGKFAQKPIASDVYIMKEDSLNEYVEQKSIKFRDCEIFKLINKFVLVYTKRREAYYEYPIEVSSFILSYSRVVMNSIITVINGFKYPSFYYSDTDSLFIDIKYLKLLEPYISHSQEIGKLKQEDVFIKGLFIGNKMKALISVNNVEHITFKGFKNLDFKTVELIFLTNLIEIELKKLNKLDTETNNQLQQIKYRCQTLFKKDIKEGIIIQIYDKSQSKIGPNEGVINCDQNVYDNVKS